MRRFSFRPALEFRGREFKGLRGFAGKPFHPPLTDIPVGAYIIAPILDLISFLWSGSSWADDAYRAAGLTLLVGAIFSLATALTGYFDWLDTDKGTQIRRIVNAHAWTMITLTVFVVIDLAVRYLGTDEKTATGPIAILAIIIAGLVAIGGTIGGTITYDFGFNVETAGDNPVYHPSDRDIVHPHDEPPS